LPIPHRLATICCFLDLESRNINNLILIPSRLARATLAGVLRREAPAIRGAATRHPQSQERRVPDLAARPLSAQVLSELLERKPLLLRPLAQQILPPPLAATRLRISGSTCRRCARPTRFDRCCPPF